MIYLGAKRPNIDSIAELWKAELHGFLFDKRENLCLVKDGYKVVFLQSQKKIDAGEAAYIKIELD